MNLVSCLILVSYLFWGSASGISGIKNVSGIISVEEENSKFNGPSKNNVVYTWDSGTKHALKCILSNAEKKMRLFLIDPAGNVVQRDQNYRYYIQERLTKQAHSRYLRTELELLFNPTTVEDTGIWECKSSDQTISHLFSICVLDKLIFENTTSQVVIHRGRSVTLVCKARGEPEPIFRWYKKEELLTDDNSTKFKVTNKYTIEGPVSVLTIANVDKEDSGSYSCIAVQENLYVDFDCSYTDLKKFEILVTYAPEFKSGDLDIYVYAIAGKSYKLTCDAEGIPTPQFTWYKNNHPNLDFEIKRDKILQIEIDENSFEIKYVCRAHNMLGEVYKTFILKKMLVPQEPYELSIKNTTKEEISLDLMWNGEPIYPIQTVTLQYFDSDTGKIPTNYDWATAKEINIQVDDAKPKENLTISVNNLTSSTQYWIRVRGSNEAGFSPWSNPLLASTTESIGTFNSISSSSHIYDISVIVATLHIISSFILLPFNFFYDIVQSFIAF